MKCPTCKKGKLKMEKYEAPRGSYAHKYPKRKERAVMVCDKCEHREVFN